MLVLLNRAAMKCSPVGACHRAYRPSTGNAANRSACGARFRSPPPIPLRPEPRARSEPADYDDHALDTTSSYEAVNGPSSAVHRCRAAPGTAPPPCQSPVNGRIRQDYAVLAFRAVSEFGAAILRQLDTEDVGELRRLLGVDRVRDGRLLDAPEKARQLGIHPNTLVRMAREGRIPATKVGRSGDLRRTRARFAAGHFAAACDT